jgi:ribosome-binding factor A
MTTRKRPGCDLRGLCAQAHDDDGIDPRNDRRHNPEPRASRKDMQLCKQVERALAAALEGECGDPILNQLDILGVEPAPNAGRLRVLVMARAGSPDVPGREILERLGHARGYLRSQLVGAIHRKRVPELIFALGTFPNEEDDEA